MTAINQIILNSLEKSLQKLSIEALTQISSFVKSKKHPGGGFMDRAGNQDPYYSVFGYTLTYLFDIEIDTKKELQYLLGWSRIKQTDFIHAISLLRSYYIVLAIHKKKYWKFLEFLSTLSFVRNLIEKKIARQVKRDGKHWIEILENYRSNDGGFNQNKSNAENATVYATFLAWGLWQDLSVSQKTTNELVSCILPLKKADGSFVNDIKSKSGVTTATAAGICMLKSNKKNNNDSTDWLKKQILSIGGFAAADGASIADLLSTSTALLALNLEDEQIAMHNNQLTEFVNLHWDNSGGFFGSIADQIPDVEYTYYGLLALGLIT